MCSFFKLGRSNFPFFLNFPKIQNFQTSGKSENPSSNIWSFFCGMPWKRSWSQFLMFQALHFLLDPGIVISKSGRSYFTHPKLQKATLQYPTPSCFETFPHIIFYACPFLGLKFYTFIWTCNLVQPRCILLQPRCTLVQPRSHLVQPRPNLVQPRSNLVQP